MTMTLHTKTQCRGRRRLLAGLIAATAFSGVVAASASANAAPAAPAPVTAGSRYLALGDSVAFGYREATNPPAPNYFDAASFVGYPENIGAELGLQVTNATCPGETSASLINDKAQSYACETNYDRTGPGYRTYYPLHVKYQTSQLRFAVHFLMRHPDTRLVSLAIGANDGFLCQATTSDNCASEIGGVLAKVKTNVGTILSRLRNVAGYTGQIVIVNYYSTNYGDPTANASSLGLNQAMDAAAAPYDATIADGYGAFEKAAAQYGGDSCKAGLLTVLTGGGCGVHPSVAGQEVLAGAVERVIQH